LRLYVVNIVVFVLFGALLILAGMSRHLPMAAQSLGWGFMLRDPGRAVPAALTLLYQPEYMGILPIFVWCMLALPFFSALEARFGDRALLVPIALYAAAHVFDLNLPSLGPDTGIAFDPFAWQILFMLGAWLGRRALLDGEALPWRAPAMRWGTAAAIAVLLAGFVLRLIWYGFLPLPAPVAESPLMVGKEMLALPRLLHGMALAWVVALYVPRDRAWMHGLAGSLLAAIGRHSLYVFCLGLFLSWGATTAFRLLPAHGWLDPLLIGGGCAVLALFARALDYHRIHARRVATA
jgi:hypothetical protein